MDPELTTANHGSSKPKLLEPVNAAMALRQNTSAASQRGQQRANTISPLLSDTPLKADSL